VDTLQQLPHADLAAVCTRRPERLREIAAKYGVGKTFTDYRALLADPEIDMVSIVTHVDDHLEPALAAIAAGKHVFLEKPMAGSVEECDRIIAALKGTPRAFMVGHICRFDSVYALAKEEIAAGRLGRIVSMHARRNLARWITESHLCKISALFGDGVHDLDLMLWFTGARPKSVFAQTSKTREQLVHDDLGWAMFRLDNEAIAVIENVWCLPENAPFAIDARMEIVGTEGAIYIDNSGSHYALLTGEGWKYPQATYWPKVHGQRRGYLKEELDYFLKCVIAGEKPAVITPEEARTVVNAVRMAERAAELGRVLEF
jgi:UDP-N-acetylglucosamine 3-dehydrogenase